MTPHRYTVIGTGFAAISAIQKLRALDNDAEITVINNTAEFVFLPSLIWIPSGLREPRDIKLPLDIFFVKQDVEFFEGEVTGLKEGGRIVETTNGDVENDGLIIASGGRFIKKLPGIEHVITPCEGIDAAVHIRHQLVVMKGGTIAIGFGSNPNEPSAMRGGPMFEFLFGIDTLLRQQDRREAFRLVFFNPAKQPGQRLGPKAVEGLKDEMALRDIEMHLGHKIKGFEKNKVITEGGEIDADLILFMPGMTGNKWFDNSDLPRSPGGLIAADEHCWVDGFENVYVAGDSGSFPGPDWLPKQAHMADLQAVCAAKNLFASLNKQQANHTFKIELMCIVDSGNSGMLVTRTMKRAIVLPSSKFWHWSKRIFEWWYLRRLR